MMFKSRMFSSPVLHMSLLCFGGIIIQEEKDIALSYHSSVNKLQRMYVTSHPSLETMANKSSWAYQFRTILFWYNMFQFNYYYKKKTL